MRIETIGNCTITDPQGFIVNPRDKGLVIVDGYNVMVTNTVFFNRDIAQDVLENLADPAPPGAVAAAE